MNDIQALFSIYLKKVFFKPAFLFVNRAHEANEISWFLRTGADVSDANSVVAPSLRASIFFHTISRK